jgi:hypothetical protein
VLRAFTLTADTAGAWGFNIDVQAVKGVAAMHGVSQQNAPVLLIAAGLPQLPLLLKNAKLYAERLFDYRTIGGLPRSKAATALTVPAQRLNASFEPEALERILDLSGGYPHFLQQWGETVWRESAGPLLTSPMSRSPKSSSTMNSIAASFATALRRRPRPSRSTWQQWPTSAMGATARPRSPLISTSTSAMTRSGEQD